MIVLFVIGVLLLGMAVLLAIRAIAHPRLRTSAHLRQIENYGFSGSIEGEASGATVPLPSRLHMGAERLGRYTAAAVPVLTPVPSDAFVSAGLYTVSSDAFHGYRVLVSALLLPLVIVLATALGISVALTILLAILFAAASWVLFASYVRRRGEARLDEIDRALPELIDLLTATIEAGLGFAASLVLVADRFSGSLGTELRLTLQEQSMGLSTTQALSNMLKRCDSPAMRAFVRTIVQGESLGVSVGTMMRNLAIEMRRRRRQRAHEHVQKAPVKMLFPLIFLIFPSLLIVLLYPALHDFAQALAGG